MGTVSVTSSHNVCNFGANRSLNKADGLCYVTEQIFPWSTWKYYFKSGCFFFSFLKQVQRELIYEANCLDVAQGRMNEAPNETRTYFYRFTCQVCTLPKAPMSREKLSAINRVGFSGDDVSTFPFLKWTNSFGSHSPFLCLLICTHFLEEADIATVGSPTQFPKLIPVTPHLAPLKLSKRLLFTFWQTLCLYTHMNHKRYFQLANSDFILIFVNF